MKNLFLIVILSSVSLYTQAQTFAFPQTTVNGETYNCSLSDYFIYVSNTNNQFDNASPNGNNVLACLSFIDDVKDRRSKIKTALQQTFDLARVETFVLTGKISIYFKIDKNGNVLEVSFSFSKELPITPQDIVTLEQKMKLIKFIELREEPRCSSSTQNINYIPITEVVRFRNLYP